MELHFYTTYDNINFLRNGADIIVWSKDNARPFDVHVSLDLDKYTLYQTGEGRFKVWATKQ